MYSLIRFLSRFLLRLFFSDVEVSGLDNIPSKGPVIIVGNHKNQFVDPMIVMSQTNRPISFITAEKSMHRPIIGTVARWAKAVPVVRAQDRAFDGQGLIVSNDSSKRIVIGVDTDFTASLQVGSSLKLPGMEAVRVTAIKSDTEVEYELGEKNLELSVEAAKQDSKNTETTSDGVVGVKYRIYPKVPQSEVFADVHKRLADGAAIGIFPEGGSSDRTDLLPFKAGVSIMAVGAAAQGTPVRVIPFGINYFSGYTFRSRVFVEIGEAMTVEPELLERLNAGEKREVYQEFLRDVEARLRNVTFNAPDHHTMMVMRTMRRLYQGSIKLSFRKQMELNRRFVSAYQEFHDKEPLLQKLVTDVADYLDECKAYGVRDLHVQSMPPLGGCSIFARAFFNFMASILVFILCFVIVIPNMTFNLPALLRINVVVNREMKKALVGSSVKVKGLDVAASQKIITAAIWFPATWIIETALLAILLHIFWPSSQDIDILSLQEGSDEAWVWDAMPWIWPVFFILTIFPVSVIASRLLEIATRARRLMPKYLLIMGSLCRGHTSAGGRLRERRKELQLRVQNVFESNIIPLVPRWAGDRIITRRQIEDNRRSSQARMGEQVKIELSKFATSASANSNANANANANAHSTVNSTVNTNGIASNDNNAANATATATATARKSHEEMERAKDDPKNSGTVVPHDSSGVAQDEVRVDQSAMRRSIRGSVPELDSVGETKLEGGGDEEQV